MRLAPGFLFKRGAVGPTRNKWRRRFFVPTSECLLYFASEAVAGEPSNALGSLSLAELLRVTVVSAALHEWEVRTERRTWSFRAESEAEFLAWVEWLEEQCQARKSAPLVLPIEGFMRKRGERGVIKAMKTRFFRQVAGQVYYFKSKQESMDPRRAQGSIDLGRVVSVQGSLQSSAAGLIEVTMQGGRVYELEVPMPDFDRTLKSFCAFSPAVFVANWPPAFSARILEHSVWLLRQQPGQLNTFLTALLSRTPVFEEEKALAALACVDQWLSLYSDELPLDVEIVLQCAQAVVDSELCALCVAFLEMCYRNFGALTSNKEVRQRLMRDTLTAEWFQFAFLHWSVSVRWVYFQLLAAVVKEDGEWKALVMDRIDAVDMQSPYLDLLGFKEAVEAAMALGPEVLPPLRSLPAKPNPFGIVQQQPVAGSGALGGEVKFKD